MKNKFGIGYISRRNDNITELRINGYAQVERIITLLKPYMKFKKIQAGVLLKSAKILQKKNMSEKDHRKLVDNILIIQSENYATKKKKSKEELLKVLGLTP